MARYALVIAALLAAAVAASAVGDCPGSCTECRDFTQTEKDQMIKAKEQKVAEWKNKVAAKFGDTNKDGKVNAADVPARPERTNRHSARADKVWKKCTACDTTVSTLVGNHCQCNDGHGLTIPTVDTATGRPAKPMTPSACSKCSGDTPLSLTGDQIDWTVLGFVKKEGRHGARNAAPTTGGRHLLGGKHGAGMRFCAPAKAKKP